MAVDFQQVRKQVQALGESAPVRARHLLSLKNKAFELLEDFSESLNPIRNKVEAAVSLNANLRCALPAAEFLNANVSAPPMPESLTLLAADGSQINPDRHGPVDYSLINVGAIQMTVGSSEAPQKYVESRLLYDTEMYTDRGRITEQILALMRDLEERTMLARLSTGLPAPIITLTDGPLELWIGRDSQTDARLFQEKFDAYIQALTDLKDIGAVTAGYVDKPGADLVVRLLEIADLPGNELEKAGRERPFRGITDATLFEEILGTGERSAVFGIQSKSADQYAEDLALHFFYLNVGQTPERKPYLARVEIPKWVARLPHNVE